MKKIVILTQYFPPEIGAPQSRLYETAIGLKERGWDVTIIAAMPNYPTGRVLDPYRRKFFINEHIDDMNIFRYAIYASNSKDKLPRIISMLSFSFTALSSVFKLNKLKPDYILTESPPLTLGLTGLMLAKMCGAKHILNISDLWPLSAYKLGALSNGFLYRQLKKLERFLYKRSFACTGQSKQITDHVKKNGSMRTHLFRNGVDINRFNKDCYAHDKDPAELKVVYTGLLGIAQGVLDICRNIDFKELNASLHIYGDGNERREIEAFVHQNPGKNIFYYGSVARKNIPNILSGYDVMLVPLKKPIYGAIPSKMYEAMAACLPVIFAGGGEGAQIVKDYQVGWSCKPADYSEIKECILKVSKLSVEELTHIRNNCHKAAFHTFNREIQTDHLHQFLSDNISHL